MGRLRARVLDAAALPTGTKALKQKVLSGMVDAAVLQQLLREADDDPWFHARESLIASPGAGAWLTAPPAQDGREMDAMLFRVALKRRLGCPMAEEDYFCPCCGQCSDRWGDHALVCACNGDRTVLHNAVRNICYEEARLSGVRPERGEAGLLPAAPATTDCRPPRLRAARPTSGPHEACKVTPKRWTSLAPAGFKRASFAKSLLSQVRCSPGTRN